MVTAKQIGFQPLSILGLTEFDAPELRLAGNLANEHTGFEELSAFDGHLPLVNDGVASP
jgi:hypothetical protein